jgi:uncharacterized membrane protein
MHNCLMDFVPFEIKLCNCRSRAKRVKNSVIWNTFQLLFAKQQGNICYHVTEKCNLAARKNVFYFLEPNS